MSQRKLDSFFKRKDNGANSRHYSPPVPKKQRIESSQPLLASELAKASLESYALAPHRSKEPMAEPMAGHDPKIRQKFRDRLKDGLRRHTEETETVSAGKPKKLSDFQQQIVDLKRNHPDTLLVFEVGYHLRFYGSDAASASRELNLSFIPGKLHFDNLNHPDDAKYSDFARCTFTAHLHSRIRSLVQKGYKVGYVKQSETSALKAVGNNKSKPFVRQLSQLYTNGTYIDDLALDGDSSETDNVGGYLLTICEQETGPASFTIALVAVQTSTGDVIYDQFVDSALLVELETRLLHIQPVELILVGDLSEAARRMVKNLTKSQLAGGAKVRVNNVARPDTTETASFLSKFYMDLAADNVNQNQLEMVLAQSDLVKACFHSSIVYLQQFNLQHVFSLVQHFAPFSSQSHMKLNGNVLTSLDMFVNQTTHKPQGSLFSIMDHTRTAFGQRLLRRWIAKPLLVREQLESRIQAVSELKQQYSETCDRAVRAMTGLFDLEKGLARIYYGRASRKQLYYVLKKLQAVSSKFSESNPDAVGFKSPLLNRLFAQLPSGTESTTKFLRQISVAGAEADSVQDFFVYEETDYEEVADYKMQIGLTEQKLQKYIHDIRTELGLKPPQLDYCHVADNVYLIKVKNAHANKVPESWTRHSKISSEIRFVTAESQRLVQELKRYQELLDVECERAYVHFQGQVRGHYEEYRLVVNALAQIDCLMSLTAVSAQQGYVLPKFVDVPCINIEAGRHPMVERLSPSVFVANDVDMATDKDRVVVLTGPNMGGKSSYVRQVALICIMAQVGCYVPAASAELGMVDAVYTRMGAYDNMMSGESTFQVELKECSDIMKSATPRSLVILDEIGRGTGTMDGMAIAHGVLCYFASECKALTLFITHYPMLSTLESVYPGIVANYHMGFVEEDDHETITFLYTVEPGVAHRSYGLNVARLANLPGPVIDVARQKSSEIEKVLTQRQRDNIASRLASFYRAVVSGEDITEDRLVEVLEVVE